MEKVYDCLVIGSGGAGMSSALKAHSLGASVAIVSKTYPTNSQSVMAQGGINISTGDDISTHMDDTYRGGVELGDLEAISYMCSSSFETLQTLESYGAVFDKNKDSYAKRSFGGSKSKRTHYSSDKTGHTIINAMQDRLFDSDIELYFEHCLLDLIVKDNICSGVYVWDIKNGKVLSIFAKAVILATGGYAKIFWNKSTNANANTGDGIMAAFRAGARLSNLEFIQFHPTALIKGSVLISESARGEGGFLVDENNNRFVDELATRDIVTRAVYQKNSQGIKTFLDMRHLDHEIIDNKLPQENELCRIYQNSDMKTSLIEISPASHYSMGGIDCDIDGKSSINGLYAVGECANNMVHGANRLGGNSLLEIFVFGNRVAKSAMDYSNSIQHRHYEDKTRVQNYINSIFTQEGTESIYTIRDRLSSILEENLAISTNETKLLNAQKFINLLKANLQNCSISDKNTIYNTNLVDYLQISQMLYLSELIIRSSSARTDSIGSFFRVDFAQKSDIKYKINLILEKNTKIFKNTLDK